MIAFVLGTATTALIISAVVLSTRDSGRLHGLIPHQQHVQRPNRVVERFGTLPLARQLPSFVQPYVLVAVVLGLVLASISMLLALLVSAMVIALPFFKERQRKAAFRRRIEQDIPMTVDLIRLGVESGLNIVKALQYVVRHFDGPLSKEFANVLQQVSNGQRLGEALDDMADRLGDDVRQITSVLASGERYGSPLTASLAQLARETRLDQERHSERAARRLSVQLLFPVAGFILPAFALLTTAPLLAGSYGSLASSFH